jgi:hypothetical protein
MHRGDRVEDRLVDRFGIDPGRGDSGELETHRAMHRAHIDSVLRRSTPSSTGPRR